MKKIKHTFMGMIQYLLILSVSIQILYWLVEADLRGGIILVPLMYNFVTSFYKQIKETDSLIRYFMKFMKLIIVTFFIVTLLFLIPYLYEGYQFLFVVPPLMFFTWGRSKEKNIKSLTERTNVKINMVLFGNVLLSLKLFAFLISFVWINLIILSFFYGMRYEKINYKLDGYTYRAF